MGWYEDSYHITGEKAPKDCARYHFVIRDTGIGISPEFQKHIFENFAREETATVSGIQGTGLGLAITKKIVEMMAGTIRLESEEGVGSEFDVCLTFQLAGVRKVHQKIDSIRGLRVLVADDGSVAVEKMAASQPEQYDLILMDIQMPVLNGYEATRQIRALNLPHCKEISCAARLHNGHKPFNGLWCIV